MQKSNTSYFQDIYKSHQITGILLSPSPFLVVLFFRQGRLTPVGLFNAWLQRMTPRTTRDLTGWSNGTGPRRCGALPASVDLDRSVTNKKVKAAESFLFEDFGDIRLYVVFVIKDIIQLIVSAGRYVYYIHIYICMCIRIS